MTYNQKLKSPLWWVGGKARMAKTIVKLIAEREHRLYCEPFGGAASVLLAKPPSELEIYNDLNEYVVGFFLCLVDDKKRHEVQRVMRWLPKSRGIFNRFKQELLDGIDDDVARAIRFFYLNRHGFGGKTAIKAAYYGVGAAQRWHATMNHINNFDALGERLRHVTIENIDGLRCIKTYDREFALFYIDPPYMPTTKRKAHHMICLGKFVLFGVMQSDKKTSCAD